RLLADFNGGRPSSPVCFGDRTQPNAVGGRDLWREHGAESENACPAHVEPKPYVSALCLIVTHARCPAAHAHRSAMLTPRRRADHKFSLCNLDCHEILPQAGSPCN